METISSAKKSKQINFWKEGDAKKFESIHIIDLELIYAACTTDRHIASIIIKRDGIGLRGDYQPLIKYRSDWNEVSSMCTNSGQLYVAHGSGVDEVSLATLNVVRIISAGGWRMPNATHSCASWRRNC